LNPLTNLSQKPRINWT